MRIFAEVPWIRGVKRQWGNRKRRFSVLRILRKQGRQQYKYTMRLHVYVVRQNGTRKSNLDAFVAVQERFSVTQVNLVACTTSFVNEIQNISLYAH